MMSYIEGRDADIGDAAIESKDRNTLKTTACCQWERQMCTIRCVSSCCDKRQTINSVIAQIARVGRQYSVRGDSDTSRKLCRLYISE